MADTEYDELAREYGLEDIEGDEQYYMNTEPAGYAAQPVLRNQTNNYFATYDDIEDFEDDAAFSSPSPPERIPSHYRSGPQPQYLYSQSTYQSQPYLAPRPTSQAEGNSVSMFTQHAEAFSQQISRIASTPAHRSGAPEARYPTTLQPYPMPRAEPRPSSRAAPQQERSDRDDHPVQRGSYPRNAHGIRLRPTSDLPDVYRALFKFGVFNAVQSTCYDRVMYSGDNMVISAPTGSGKTVIFELAIIRMLIESSRTGRQTKCIYVAPTKALCSEKYRDWTTKFQSLSINCCELTGDTVQFGKSAWGDAKNATIIVTTGEKWDSLTRNWEDHEQILSQISLFLVDEVHILNETRGSTLEVVISRMKLRGTSVRFVMVSATVPNIQDVAAWVGNDGNDGSAIAMEFGEEYRACRLTRHVVPVLKKRDQNDFQFQRILDYKLYPVLQQHSQDKPVLVFCATRKGVVASAEQLMREYEQSLKKRDRLPWSKPGSINHQFHDKKLDKLAACGIGVHHAGLMWDDRRATEDLFLKKVLRVVVATSTLAVGVNLPAHTVVIKGVKIFATDGWQEYSDLDIMQMTGRAGRPQFDKEGVAIIMCESELEPKYRALTQGRTFLESCLHNNLAEHINSEIGLGTITNVDSAKHWLHSSFLFRRIQKNPRHYAIGKGGNQTWQERIDEMVLESIERLKKNQLVESPDDDHTVLMSTEYGDIMSKYYIRQSTMNLILKLPEKATLRDMLEALASAEEFSEIKIRAGEKQIYGKLKAHDDIRFKMKKVEKVSDKISLIIQAILAGISLNDNEYRNGDNQPSLEAVTIWRHIARLVRAMVEVAIVRQCGAQVKYGMELMRCVSAKAWEDRPVVLRQIDQIGEKSIKVLVQHGITTFQQFTKQEPARLEMLLNRRMPFGHEVLAFIKSLPQYYIHIEEVSATESDGRNPVEVELLVTVGMYDSESVDSGKSKKGKTKFRDSTTILSTNSELDFIDFRRISTKMLKPSKTFTIIARLTKPSQSVVVQAASETIAGITITESYKPRLPHSAYPTMDTRPRAAIEGDLIDNTAFLATATTESFSDEEEEVVVKKDLARSIATIDMTSQPSKPQKPVKASKPPSGQKVKTWDNDNAESVSTPPVPNVLPNGNYACNHSCKDKTVCRHLCCREGLPKPPAWTKKRLETLYSAEQPKKVQEPPQKTKHRVTAPPKPDRRLKQLEELHTGTNVKASIQLQEGRRLKLDDGTPDSQRVYGKKRKAPNFNLAFTDITAGEPDPGDEIDELEDSGDELPDTHDILTAFGHKKENKARTSASSSTRYSDPEVDELIRNMPSPVYLEPSPARAMSSTRPDEAKDYDFTMSSPPPATPPAQKRPCSIDELAVPSKKRKLTQPPFSVSSEETTNGVPLFWAVSSGPSAHDDGAEVDELANGHDFYIDESIFDVQPANSQPLSSTVAQAVSPVRTAPFEAASTSQQGATRSAHSASSTISRSSEESRLQKSAPLLEDVKEEELHPWDVAMAEFAEWLESDAVVVVENSD